MNEHRVLWHVTFLHLTRILFYYSRSLLMSHECQREIKSSFDAFFPSSVLILNKRRILIIKIYFYGILISISLLYGFNRMARFYSNLQTIGRSDRVDFCCFVSCTMRLNWKLVSKLEQAATSPQCARCFCRLHMQTWATNLHVWRRLLALILVRKFVSKLGHILHWCLVRFR